MMCPNKNLPEWKELESVLPTTAEYYWAKNGGNPLDFTPNGKPSKLFADILKLEEVNGDRRQAIVLKSKLYNSDFLDWFGNWTIGEGSSVVDENKEPMIVYHGSSVAGIEVFKENDGIFSTNSVKAAREIYGEEVYPMFVKANPKEVSLETLDSGNRGIGNTLESGETITSQTALVSTNQRVPGLEHKEFVVYSNNNIKPIFSGSEILNNTKRIYSNIQVSPGLNKENYKGDGLAIALWNQLSGLNLSEIEELTYEDINALVSLDKPVHSYVTGGSLGKKVTVSEFLNQKALFPKHVIILGKAKIYPNYNEKLQQEVKGDLNKSLSELFEEFKTEQGKSNYQSFILEDAEGNLHKIEAEFIPGFVKLANHIESLISTGLSKDVKRKIKNEENKANKSSTFTPKGAVESSVIASGINTIKNEEIKRAINRYNIPVKYYSDVNDNRAGFFQTGEGTVYINEMVDSKDINEVIGHELTHAVTHYSLKFIEDFKDDIQQLFDKAKKATDKSYYGLTNLDEFLAEGFNNKEFITFLQNTKETKTSKLTLFEAFINSIYKLFKGKNKYNAESVDVSLFNELTNAIIKNKNTLIYAKQGNSELSSFGPASETSERGEKSALLQKTAKSQGTVVPEIEDKLTRFLNTYGISVDYVSSLKERGFDAVAIADITNKLILISKGKAGIDTLPEEAAHFAVELLGENNPLVQRLMSIIEGTDTYIETFEEYKNDEEYQLDGKPDIEKIKKEAIGKAIANEIIKNKNIETNKSVLSTLNRMWDKIMSMFKKIDNRALNEELSKVSSKVASSILNNTLEGNTANLKKYEGKTPVIFKSKTSAKAKVEATRAEQSLKTLETRLKQIGRRLNSPESVLELKATIIKIKRAIDTNQNLLGINHYLNIVSSGTMDLLERIDDYRNGDESVVINADILYDINNYLNLHEETMGQILRMATSDRSLQERAPNLLELARETYSALGESRIFLKEAMEEKTIEGVNSIANDKELGNKLFRDADRDLNFFSTWLGAAKNSSKEVIRLLDKMLRKLKYNTDSFIRVLGTDLTRLQVDLENSGFKDFGKFYEKDAKGKKTGYLIREYNWGTYYKVREEFKKSLAETFGVKEYKDLDVDSMSEGFREQHAMLWKDFYNKHTNNRKGKTVPAEMYRNREYDKLMSNPKVANYYNKLVEIKKDAVEKLPPSFRSDNFVYRMPQIRKDTLNRLKSREQSIFKTTKELINESVSIQIDETEYGSSEIVMNPITGEEIKFLPIHYNYMLNDMNNLSDDISSIYISYAHMAEFYNQKNMAKGELWLIKEAVKEQKVTNKKGTTPGAQTNQTKIVENMINARFYGEEKNRKTEFTNPFNGKKYNLTKMVDTFLAYVRRNNLVNNVFTHVANNVMGGVNSTMEAIAGRYTTVNSAIFAEKEIDKHILNGGLIKDIGKKLKTNKVSLLLQKNDIIYNIRNSFQGLDEKSVFGRVFNNSGLFATYQLSDTRVKGKVAIAVYDNYRLFEGEYISNLEFKALHKGDKEASKKWSALRDKSLYNSYEVRDNKFLPKKEFEQYITRNLEDRIKGTIEQITDEVDGTLTEHDKSLLHRNVWGRAILTHRNWLLVGGQARWKPKGYSYVTGMEEEGYHRTFGKAFVEIFKGKDGDEAIKGFQDITNRFKTILTTNPDLSDTDKANIRKAWADLVFILAVMMVAGMLNSLADDEPDDLLKQFAAYMGTRVATETQSYSNPFAVFDILKSPSAGINQVESLAQGFTMLMPTVNEDWEWGWKAFEEIERGAYKDKTRMEKLFIQRSLLKPFYEISNIEAIKAKNRYLKQVGL